MTNRKPLAYQMFGFAVIPPENEGITLYQKMPSREADEENWGARQDPAESRWSRKTAPRIPHFLLRHLNSRNEDLLDMPLIPNMSCIKDRMNIRGLASAVETVATELRLSPGLTPRIYHSGALRAQVTAHLLRDLLYAERDLRLGSIDMHTIDLLKADGNPAQDEANLKQYLRFIATVPQPTIGVTHAEILGNLPAVRDKFFEAPYLQPFRLL